jgi:hypothetical protein
MKHLNWKDCGKGSTARASRDVGGYYLISWHESYVSAFGETIEAHYEIEYRRRTRHDWEDIDIDYPRWGWPGPGTLDQAKALAEEDCEQRRRELLSDDEATIDEPLIGPEQLELPLEIASASDTSSDKSAA